MKKSPFWVDDHPRSKGLGQSELPDEIDYLIVGSGLTGLSAGLRLVEAGNSVAILDKGEIAGGASSINGGMVSPDVKAGVQAVEARHGPEIATEMWHATVRSVDLVQDLCRRYEIDAEINTDGMAALALSRKEIAKFQVSARWLKERFGVEREVLGPDRIDELAVSDSFHGALFESDAFGIHPAKYAFGLARQFQNSRGLARSNCEVTSISPTKVGYEVETTEKRLRASQVIVATNGYTTDRPLPGLIKKVVPIGSYIIVTEPLTQPEAEAIFPSNAMTYTRRRLLHYMRRTPDDRILIGGRRNLKTDLPLEESASDLSKSLVHYFPQLAEKTITHVWGGRLAVPFDLTPHIGRLDGAWYAMGYAGHGVGLSTLLGHDLAGMLLGEDPASPFARIPHNGRFYYQGRPWFLSPASIMYRAFDRFGI